MATPSLGSKNHRNRKNPAAAEFYAKQRKARNAERPKQITTVDQLVDGTLIYKGPVRP